MKTFTEVRKQIESTRKAQGKCAAYLDELSAMVERLACDGEIARAKKLSAAIPHLQQTLAALQLDERDLTMEYLAQLSRTAA